MTIKSEPTNNNSKPSSDQKPPYIATIFALITFVLLLSLGTWQMQRAEHKQHRLEQIEQRKDTDVMSINQLLESDDPRDLSFEVNGELLVDTLLLVDNRIEAGQVGFFVLAPVRTSYGVIIVNFGWVKANRYRDKLPQIALDSDIKRFFGTSAIPTLNPMVTETASANDPWPKVIQQIDLALIAEFTGTPLLPFVMQLDPDEGGGFVRNWTPVVMAPEKHYAYALQWYGLAIACLIIYFVALRKRKQKKNV